MNEVDAPPKLNISATDSKGDSKGVQVRHVSLVHLCNFVHLFATTSCLFEIKDEIRS